MTTFTTETGSVYEVAPDRKQIRRLEGTHDPTPRQGPDGEWKEFISISQISIGSSVLIGWRIKGNTLQGTLTSSVGAIT